MTQETAVAAMESAPVRRLPSRLPSLTGARFVAACMVFCFHSFALFPLAAPGTEKIPDTLFGAGYSGVTFFFALSGFVLAWSMRPTDTVPAFWRRRFFKIYPNHLLTFLASAVLLATVDKATLDKGDGVLNLLLLQAWHPGLAHRNSYNPVSWSLSCEALFYFCFPLLNKLIDKVRPERLWYWTILSAASVICLPAVAGLLFDNPPFPQGYNAKPFWIVYQFPPTQMLTFIFGIFLAKLVLSGQRLPLRFGGAMALAVGAYFVMPLFPTLYQFGAVMVFPLGLVIAGAAVADIERQRTFLGSRWMVLLGDISFAFYLWHYLVLSYGHHYLGAGQHWSTPTALAVMLLLFAVTVLLSWLTFRFFELPILRRFGSSGRTRDRAVVVGTVPANSESPA
jgi:peptidoglycan/LPS O-acetylase OafA/YrhL